MQPTICVRLGAALGGLAVALGAFAAHGLQPRLDPARLETFETAVRYQFFHALALLACGLLGAHGYRTALAGSAFAAGIALFSGSLYGLAVLEWRWLGPVTPFGGAAFLVGWIALAASRREALGNRATSA